MTTSVEATKTKPTSIRLTSELRMRIDRLAGEAQRSTGSIISELLEEGVRMRRVPGIVFADTAGGRRALVAGTGIKVWLIIDTYVRMGEDFDALKAHYDWLSDFQLRAAVTYWRTYPDEIDKELNLDEEAFVREIYEQYPFMKPPHLS